MTPRPPTSTIFPYTTLCRSRHPRARQRGERAPEIDGELVVVERRLRPFPRRPPHRPGPVQVVDQCADRDRKSTRLNSSHANISYAVFCLKKKNEHDVVQLLG